MSRIVVVDTNIVSYIFNHHSLAMTYSVLLQGCTLIIAAQTVEELRYGAFKANWGQKKLGELESLLKTFEVVQTSDTIRTFARVSVVTKSPYSWINKLSPQVITPQSFFSLIHSDTKLSSIDS